VKPGRSARSNRTQKQRSGPKPRKKWTKVNHSAVAQLVQASSSAAVVFPLPTSALPANLKQMPGAVSYYVSAYSSSLELSSNLTAGGEMAVVRTDADRAKAYNFIFATSSDGAVYFNGPYKDFAEHHFATDTAIPIDRLFGHTPFKEK
jgi:hypothetical protein